MSPSSTDPRTSARAASRRRRLLASAAPVAAMTGGLLWADVPPGGPPATVANPVFDGADPSAHRVGGEVWVYPTSGPAEGRSFFVWSSSDLATWRRHGPVLNLGDVAWVKEDGARVHWAWAPCLAEKNGRFYLYYSVGPQNPTPSRIGVAVADSPAGPFVDSGRPLLTGGKGFEAIDPAVFTDPRDGETYLYAGGSAGATLRVFELADDMTSFAREVPVDTPPHFTEGAFVHERRGVYYLSYSHGGWRDASYGVHYATASSAVGPWTYRGRILASDDRHKGPGHHSIVTDPATGDTLIVYHRWNNAAGRGPYRGTRRVAIDALEYDENGLIRPVVMTDIRPATRPADAPRRAA